MTSSETDHSLTTHGRRVAGGGPPLTPPPGPMTKRAFYRGSQRADSIECLTREELEKPETLY